MPTKKQWILGGAIAIAVTAIGVLALRPGGTPVEVSTVRRDSLQESVVAEGRTRLRDRFAVAAPVSGRLRRIELREGQLVERGAVLARLDPVPEDPRSQATARARVAAAEAGREEAAAQLARVEGDYQQALREATRRRRLASAGALSAESLEQAELTAASARRLVEAAGSGVRAADADVLAARSALIGADPGGNVSGAAVAIRAPLKGRVLRILEPSERVVPGGTLLLELGDVAGLEVVIDVLSRDAARIGVGDPVSFSEWGGDQVLQGRVRVVGPDARTKISALGVEEQRVDVIADLEDAPPALGVGFRVEARIATWRGADRVVVPTSALFPDAAGWQVFRVEDGRARRRPVVIGRRNEAVAEVTSGLTPGDDVILFPSDLIGDGVLVVRHRSSR